MNTETKDNSIRDGVRVRRQIFIPPDLARRLDGLVARGVVASNVIGVALRRTLTTIENQIAAGKDIPGIKIRK